MKRRRETERRGTKRDAAHLFALKLVGSCWVRDMVPNATPCTTRVTQNDHSAYKGVGQKCDDDDTADICVGHHQERTDRTGTFDGMPIELEREYRAKAIDRARAKVARWRDPAIPF